MKRGWCPGVHEPMQSGDGLLIRIKPFGGKLSADALRSVAEVAMRCGNGVVELTGRGNIQLRGLSEASAPTAASALVDAGLADPDPMREARRNVIAVPPCDDALVAAIEAIMADISGLPAKFCVAVGATRADIQVIDGQATASPSPRPSPALRERELLAAIQDLLASERLLSRKAGEGRGEGEAMLIGLPFGQTDAAALVRLAALTGHATLRTTPWRAFYLPGLHDPAPFAAAGFITDPDDPRRTIAACAGAPACASASVPARADAAFLAARGIRGIHVSGCAKGCAHPAAATTLVGIGGAYGLVQHGRAGDRPSITGLTIAQAAALLA